MAHAADDRAQAERHGSGWPSRHLSAGNEAAGYPWAGGTRADNQPGDRLPRFAREARAPRARAQAAAAEDGHANLRKRLPELQNDPELRDTIESAIHEFGIQLHDPDSYANQFAQRLIDNLVRRTVESSRGQITLMVRENLARLSDDQIRIQIESKTRTHLDWIRVNGGLFGAFFGLIFALSRILSHNGPAILAHFHIAM